jgi:hypothetical protein
VQATDIEQKGIASAELGGRGAGDVGPQEADLRAGLFGVAARDLHRLADDVHAGHVPAVARAVDRVMAGAAPDVEHVAGWQRTRALDQVGQRCRRFAVLPRDSAQAVHDLVNEAHDLRKPF